MISFVARAVLCSLALLISLEAEAGCDNIPSRTECFQGGVGCLNQPYAAPGQIVELRVRTEICDGTSLGLRDTSSGNCIDPDDVLTSVVFTPPGGAVNVIVLATSCSGAALSETQSWATTLAAQGGTAVCRDNADIAINEKDVGTGISECRLSFEFPNSDDLVTAASDELTLAGPAKIIVSPSASPLPQELASQRCAEAVGTVACIDEFFDVDGSCRTSADRQSQRFPHFTALPIFNDFAEMCSSDGNPLSPCDDGADPDFRFTLDIAGNVLAPINWEGVLFKGATQGFPPPQLIDASTTIEAFLGTGVPIRLPAFSGRSFTPLGLPLAPVFDPTFNPDDPNSANWNGSTDAVATVLRFARRSPEFLECFDAGSPVGTPCVSADGCESGQTCATAVCYQNRNATNEPCSNDADCSALGGTCGPALFDLAFLRSGGGLGPGVIPRGAYDAGTQFFVPLEGLCQSSELNCFVLDETLEGLLLNADGDALDRGALLLQKRSTGVIQKIGNDFGGAPADALAVALIQQGRSQAPVVKAEQECVAFAIPEPWENSFDINGNGDVFNSILRVLCLTESGVAEQTSFDFAIETDPRIIQSPRGISQTGTSADPIVFSDGLVYFLVPEAANAKLLVQDVPDTNAGGQTINETPIASGDGDRIAFLRRGGGQTAGAFLIDLSSGLGELVSVADRGDCNETPVPLRGPISDLALAAGGEVVAFSQTQTFGFDGRANGQALADGTDVGNGITLSVDAPGTLGAAIFDTDPSGPNLGMEDPDLLVDLGNVLILQSTDNPDQTQPGIFDTPDDSRVGGLVAFDFPVGAELDRIVLVDLESSSAELRLIDGSGRVRSYDVPKGWTKDVVDDGPDGFDTLDLTSLSDQSGEGGKTATASEDAGFDATDVVRLEIVLHGSGALSTFSLFSDMGLRREIFAHDTENCRTELISVNSSGIPADASSEEASLSADGLLVAFASLASNLDPTDTNGTWDVFLRDRSNATTLLMSRDEDDQPLPGESRKPSLSADGLSLAFQHTAPAGVPEVFIRDLVTGLVTRIGEGEEPLLSTDGRILAFLRDGQVYAYDRDFNTLALLSVNPDGTPGAFPASRLSIGNGRVIGFETQSALVPEDTDTDVDSYVVDRVTRLIKQAAPEEPSSGAPTLDESGNLIGFEVTDAGGGKILVTRAPDPNDLAADFSGDGTLDDVVLMVLDTNIEPAVLDIVAQVDQVAVSGLASAFTSGPNRHAFARYFPCGNIFCPATVHDLGINSPGGIVISDQLVCAIAADSTLHCGELGASGALQKVLDGGNPVAVDQLAVVDDMVVLTLPPDINGVRFLRIGFLNPITGAIDLLPFAEAARLFVAGENLVAFDQCETDVAADLDLDGDQNECVLKFFDRRSGLIENTFQAVIPCDSEACDARFPWRVFPDSVRYITHECDLSTCPDCDEDGICPGGNAVTALCDLNNDGDCSDQIVQQTSSILTSNLLASVTPQTGLGGGELGDGSLSFGSVFETSAGECENQPEIACNEAADCPGSQACIGFAPLLLGLPDTDGDGFFDSDDNCEFQPNRDQADSDGDGTGDLCDRFTCGDGVLQEDESCDAGSANGSEASDCSDGCTPAVVASHRLSRKREAVRISRRRKHAAIEILGSELLNLTLVPKAGLIPELRAIDTDSIRIHAVAPGASCPSSGGSTLLHDLNRERKYKRHLRRMKGFDKSIRKLRIHFTVADAGIARTTALGHDVVELCVTGRLSGIAGETGIERFESRLPVEIRR